MLRILEQGALEPNRPAASENRASLDAAAMHLAPGERQDVTRVAEESIPPGFITPRLVPL